MFLRRSLNLVFQNRVGTQYICFLFNLKKYKFLLLWCRWLKSDVTEKAQGANNVNTDAKCQSCTTLNDCFAKFTQHEEVNFVCIIRAVV